MLYVTLRSCPPLDPPSVFIDKAFSVTRGADFTSLAAAQKGKDKLCICSIEHLSLKRHTALEVEGVSAVLCSTLTALEEPRGLEEDLGHISVTGRVRNENPCVLMARLEARSTVHGTGVCWTAWLKKSEPCRWRSCGKWGCLSWPLERGHRHQYLQCPYYFPRFHQWDLSQ